MADRNVDSLQTLFHEKAMFTQLRLGKGQEIRHHERRQDPAQKAVAYTAHVPTFGNLAILPEDMDLLAEVGGRKVTSGFMVTQVYTRKAGSGSSPSLPSRVCCGPSK